MRAGFAAIVGAPNVGKSTFLNQALEFKLAITSDKPQTTRHRLMGVHHAPGLQIAFLDTPGLHQAKRALNRRMVRTAVEALEEVDAVLFVVEASRRGLAAGAELAPQLAGLGSPVVLALNKVDLMRDKTALLPMLAEADAWGEWAALVPISARRGEGCELVLAELAKVLPESEPLFPPDIITDLPVRFLAGELIREKVFRLTGQEVPYSTAVTVEEFVEPAEEGRPVAIAATIHVERPGQKAIVIGQGGQMIKRIGTEARKAIEVMLGQQAHLDLFVRVEAKWSHSDGGLGKLGY
jgi:GTP-binding protein Era